MQVKKQACNLKCDLEVVIYNITYITYTNIIGYNVDINPVLYIFKCDTGIHQHHLYVI